MLVHISQFEVFGNSSCDRTLYFVDESLSLSHSITDM